MNKYTKAQDTMRPAFAALGAVGGSQMDKLLPTGTAPFLIVGAAVVLGVVLFALLDRGFDVILGNWTWLRRQICGKAWVEGDYKNIVIDKETQSIVVGGIVTIHSDNGKVRFSGESFDEKGERRNFHSLAC